MSRTSRGEPSGANPLHSPPLREKPADVVQAYNSRYLSIGGRHAKKSPLFSCCFLTSDIHLVFASPIPNGEWTRFLPQCNQFTLTCKGLAGLIGTSLLGPDSLSPCFFYSRRY